MSFEYKIKQCTLSLRTIMTHIHYRHLLTFLFSLVLTA